MKPCREFKRELATCAVLSVTPSSSTGDHLQQCARCRNAFVALKAVAAVQLQASANLQTPSLGPRLDSWFLDTLARASRESMFRALRLRPLALCGSALLAGVLLGLLFLTRASHKRKPIGRSIAPLTMGRLEGAADAPDPTWRVYRYELHRDSDPFEDPVFRRVGAVVSHYRLKDPYFEAN
jgi:hypothetical protein